VDAGPFQDGGDADGGVGEEIDHMSLMIGAAVAGLGDLVVRYYTTDSLAERTMLREIMLKGIDLAGEVREDQANRIIAALDRALNNKSRQRRPQAV
jgi:hypothetical protein